MKLICWNIKKLNTMKATLWGADIACEIATAAGGTPFVAFLLEVRPGQGDTVAAPILAHLTGAPHGIAATATRIDAGGDAARREDILAICGNGARVDSATTYKGWQGLFNRDVDGLVQDAQATEDDRLASQPVKRLRSAAINPARAQTARNMADLMPKKGGDLRNPGLFRVSGGGASLNVMVVHSPGPGDGLFEADLNYAERYNNAVMTRAVREADVLIGDFNEHRSIGGSPAGTMRERQDGGGGTTKTASGGRSCHRYDRVFTPLPATVTVGCDAVAGTALTDHYYTVTTL